MDTFELSLKLPVNVSDGCFDQILDKLKRALHEDGFFVVDSQRESGSTVFLLYVIPIISDLDPIILSTGTAIALFVLRKIAGAEIEHIYNKLKSRRKGKDSSLMLGKLEKDDDFQTKLEKVVQARKIWTSGILNMEYLTGLSSSKEMLIDLTETYHEVDLVIRTNIGTTECEISYMRKNVDTDDQLEIFNINLKQLVKKQE